MPNLATLTQRLEDSAALLDYKHGCPLRRHLVIRQAGLDGNLRQTYTDRVVWPPPVITTVSPKLVGINLSEGNSSNSGITVAANDFVALVSRSTPKEHFFNTSQLRSMLWIDAAVAWGGKKGDVPQVTYKDTKKNLSGLECRLIHIDDSDCCHWKLILRRLKDG